MNETLDALELARSAKAKLKAVALAFPLARETGKQDVIHSDILDLLLLMANLEKILESLARPAGKPHVTASFEIEGSNLPPDTISEEIEKVLRKLPKWAANPQQINSKILKLYLDLESSGESKITETLLMERYGNHAEFLRNFNQMKIISPKNHGKVFELRNGVITVWDPIKEAVLDFKRATLRKN